jgi:hypothetical protein
MPGTMLRCTGHQRGQASKGSGPFDLFCGQRSDSLTAKAKAASAWVWAIEASVRERPLANLRLRKQGQERNAFRSTYRHTTESVGARECWAGESEQVRQGRSAVPDSHAQGCEAGSAINTAGDTWKYLASLATFAVLRKANISGRRGIADRVFRGFVLRHQEREDCEQFTLGLRQFRTRTHQLGNLTASLLVLALRADRARQVVQKQRFVCGPECDVAMTHPGIQDRVPRDDIHAMGSPSGFGDGHGVFCTQIANASRVGRASLVTL